MTIKQPEALRLADAIERYNAGVYSQKIYEDYSQAAAELRRLHEVNAELIKSLIDIEGNYPNLWAGERAREAIAKAIGEQYEN